MLARGLYTCIPDVLLGWVLHSGGVDVGMCAMFLVSLAVSAMNVLDARLARGLPVGVREFLYPRRASCSFVMDYPLGSIMTRRPLSWVVPPASLVLYAGMLLALSQRCLSRLMCSTGASTLGKGRSLVSSRRWTLDMSAILTFSVNVGVGRSIACVWDTGPGDTCFPD